MASLAEAVMSRHPNPVRVLMKESRAEAGRVWGFKQSASTRFLEKCSVSITSSSRS